MNNKEINSNSKIDNELLKAEKEAKNTKERFDHKDIFDKLKKECTK
ncbi:MAG: hypothetical protein MJ244_02560 [Clostridia bacterium]|nr:hypothetical protein [Clostridia bacterium]